MAFSWCYLHGNTFDVFLGNGWENWSRIRVGRDYTSVVAGCRIPPGTMKEIINSING